MPKPNPLRGRLRPRRIAALTRVSSMLILLVLLVGGTPLRAAAQSLPGGLDVDGLPLTGEWVPDLSGLVLPGLNQPLPSAPFEGLDRLGTGLTGGLLRASGEIVPTPGTETFSGTLVRAGVTRRYVGIRPIGSPVGAPVLLMLHPLALAPGRMANLTAVGRLAAQFGAWVYLPEAVNGSWSDNPMFPGNDDVGFLDALLAREIAAHGLDASRIYAAGYSNGGHMAERLACERPTRLAGIALVAAIMRNSLAAICGAPQRTPVLMFSGTADPITSYQDGLGTRGAVATAAFWAEKNRCAADAVTITDLPDLNAFDGATVTVTRYERCDASTVVLHTINGGGHTWPGTESSDYTVAFGATTLDIDATLELWRQLLPFANDVAR